MIGPSPKDQILFLAGSRPPGMEFCTIRTLPPCLGVTLADELAPELDAVPPDPPELLHATSEAAATATITPAITVLRTEGRTRPVEDGLRDILGISAPEGIEQASIYRH